MTEAPFVHILMQMGMGKGPALALLLTCPGVSLPNFPAIFKMFGWKKACIYAILILEGGTLTGWIYGMF